MSQRIVIIGAGFGGVWSALSAVRALDIAGRQDVEVALIAPEPTMYMRPRLYETDISTAGPSVLELLDVVGVRYIQGTVSRISTDVHKVEYASDSVVSSIMYDRLVLASGSKVSMPSSVKGLQEHAFTVDNYNDAMKLEAHLQALSSLPKSTPGRNTVVVAGGGFTGIETATELPSRLRPILGDSQVFMVEKHDEVGPELGPGPRPVILQALQELGVTSYTGESVVAVDASGAVLSSGKRIEAKTVIWTVGVRASTLTEQISGAQRDQSGRLLVDDNLKVVGVKDVFATGDAARARTDDEGHVAMMSCQHSLILGRSSGNNAAQDLLCLPLHIYRQPYYVTCLDLGAFGAVVTQGWNREIFLTGVAAKHYKQHINGSLIYPPAANRAEALAVAKPDIEYEEKDGVLQYKR
ncbi:FAD/NAD(P)-binding domain-containing protein, partial [Hymenopellis radicata]